MISNKYKAFVEEYISNGYNARQAYLSVIGGSEITTASADTLGNRILGLVEVKDYMREREEELKEQTKLKREDIIDRLNKRSLLVQDISDLASKDVLTENEEKKLKRLLRVIKTSDANKSDELLNKMLGWNEPDRQSIDFNNLPPLFPDVKYDKGDTDDENKDDE